MRQQDTSSLSGKFLIAMPGMGDARFEKTVIYICAHSEEGAMGFIINRTMEAPSVANFLKQLEIVSKDEIADIPEHILKQKMYVGGPVEPGRGFVIHTPEFQSDSTMEVTKNVQLTATLEILRAIATGKGPKHCLLALGYSGWGAGQLEEEITSNGWLTCNAKDSIIFDRVNDNKYDRALALLGVDSVLLSSDSGHA